MLYERWRPTIYVNFNLIPVFLYFQPVFIEAVQMELTFLFFFYFYQNGLCE